MQGVGASSEQEEETSRSESSPWSFASLNFLRSISRHDRKRYTDIRKMVLYFWKIQFFHKEMNEYYKGQRKEIDDCTAKRSDQEVVFIEKRHDEIKSFSQPLASAQER